MFFSNNTNTTSTEPPSQQTISNIRSMDEYYQSVIKLTQGYTDKIDENSEIEKFSNKNKIFYYNKMNSNSNNDSSGRTLNVPKQLKPGLIPKNSFNGARTTGELCEGEHCSIPVMPKSSNYISQSYSSQYISTYRPGNNTEINQYTQKYENKSSSNYGPFNITVIRNNSNNNNTNNNNNTYNNNTANDYNTNASLSKRYSSTNV